MTSDQVIQMLIDVVSKNGNLLLNIVQTPEGDLEDDVLEILEGIGRWIDDNGEAIYSSRPWKIYGEGPSMENQARGTFGGVRDVRPYQAGDVRFTTKDGKLYVFCMEPTEGSLNVKALGKSSPYYQQISSIRMLGSKEKVKWAQGTDALEIKSPVSHPAYAATVYEVQFK
jgi:alpha-L-fucosidase